MEQENIPATTSLNFKEICFKYMSVVWRLLWQIVKATLRRVDEITERFLGSYLWYSAVRAFFGRTYASLHKYALRQYRIFEDGSSPRSDNSKPRPGKRGTHSQGRDPRFSQKRPPGNGEPTQTKKPTSKMLAETKDIELPTTSFDAVARLLQCDDRNYYQILGVCFNATELAIKKSYRLQSLKVHPDKTNVTGAELAFKLLSVAYDVLGDAEKREIYHSELNEDVAREQFDRVFGDKMRNLFEDMQERKQTMENHLNCSVCHELHPKVFIDRPLTSGRYCAECNSYHVAHEGDIWVETQFVFRWHFYACLDGYIYEINEWAECMKIHDKIVPNAHDIRFSCRDSRAPKGTPRRRRDRQQSFSMSDFDSPEEFMQYLFEQAMAKENAKNPPGKKGPQGKGPAPKKKHPKKKK
eukprot:m.16077 g.16077  ORF g.16077 m.16077 type:complete len:411 (-) comp10871_c0_seq1:60-1292(-)